MGRPCWPKGSHFVLFWDIHFWLTDHKIFLKAPWAPIYTNFEGGARGEKREIFQKVPNNAFFDIFTKFACGAENLVKLGPLKWFGRDSKKK